MAYTLPTSIKRCVVPLLMGMAGFSWHLSADAQTPDASAILSGRTVYMQNHLPSGTLTARA
ncbi:MAG: hypothetical protein WB821_16045 [Burkholderiaceae bacterium]